MFSGHANPNSDAHRRRCDCPDLNRLRGICGSVAQAENGAVVSTDVVTFDADGNQIKAVGSGKSGSYTSTTTINSTMKVCR